uniref:Helicase C-terminal domain-containing protein n=1 Tax=Steinernema glaseri TaxID=37863 RepID=A0A1I8A7R1_9BILA
MQSAKSNVLGDKQKAFVKDGMDKIQIVAKLLEEQVRGVRSLDQLKKFIPHKVQRLLEILAYYNPNAPDSSQNAKKPMSSLVFVEQRYVAYVMNIMMKSLCKWEPEMFDHIKSEFIVGYSGSSLGDDSAGFHSRQETILNRFRQGILNLLFATSVLEEGVDVKHCNLVIRFDAAEDFRSHIQSRGRARKSCAQFFMLVEKKDESLFASRLRDFCEIERMLITRTATADDIEASADLDDLDYLVEPYVVESTGARVTMSSAIALVNRYCSKLPSDPLLVDVSGDAGQGDREGTVAKPEFFDVRVPSTLCDILVHEKKVLAVL